MIFKKKIDDRRVYLLSFFSIVGVYKEKKELSPTKKRNERKGMAVILSRSHLFFFKKLNEGLSCH